MIPLEYGSHRTRPPQIDAGSLYGGSVTYIGVRDETYLKERDNPISEFQ